MKSPLTLFCAAFAALCLLGPAQSRAEVTPLFDTINGFTVGSDSGVNDNTLVAQQFRTGADPFQIGSLMLSLFGPDITGTPLVTIDVLSQGTSSVSPGNWPGELVFNICTGIAPAPVDSLWTIPVADLPFLAANTTYWIAVSVSGGSIGWNYTNTPVSNGQAGNLLAATASQSFVSGTDYFVYNEPQMMTVNPVPEPTTVLFSVLGVGSIAMLRRLRLI